MMRTLFISDSRFPEGCSADVIRFTNIIRLFQMLGDEVFALSLGKSTRYEASRTGNVDYESMRGPRSDWTARFCDRLLFTGRVRKFIRASYGKWDRVVVCNIPNSLMNYLKKYTFERGIDLIYDCVEWYSKEEFTLGRLDINYIKKNRLVTKIVDDRVKVIAISTYLENYFCSRGITVVRIPALMEPISVQENPGRENGNADDKLIVIYAGSPGGKDALNVMIESFSGLKDEYKKKMELHIVGVDWKWIKRRYRYSDTQIFEAKQNVVAYGRLPREQVIDKYRNADYSILMRPEHLRYARAGFPTKVVESLAMGLPIICNLTSDLGLYLKDGINSFIVNGFSVESLIGKLEEVISKKTDRKQMKKEARICATLFQPEKYVDVLREFL